ncbi:hypothetical protein VTK26DRAFT_5416 [Humicola hyalothermophila]
MDPDFTPVKWTATGHIVDYAFSESLQALFLGISDGSIYIQAVDLADINPWGESWPPHASHCAIHHGGGLEYLRIIPGNPERLVSFASDGSVMIWRVAGERLQLIRTLHGFHSLTPPHVVACRRATSGASAGSPGDSSVFLVFATDDGALNWWDLDNFRSNATLLDGIGLITALDIDSVEDLVAVGTASGDVRVWRMSTLAYVFQTVVPGVVTKLAFLPGGEDDDWVNPGRRLAIITNESNLQIRTFGTAMGEGELLPPMTIPDIHYRDAEVFDIYPIDKDTLVVVQRDGTWRVLRCEISDSPRLSLVRLPLWRNPLNGLPLQESVNASLLLVWEEDDNTAVIPLLSYLTSSVDRSCWVGSLKCLTDRFACVYTDKQRPLRNARSMANHIVHSVPLNVFAHHQVEFWERTFDAGAFASNHDNSHVQSGDRGVHHDDEHSEYIRDDSTSDEGHSEDETFSHKSSDASTISDAGELATDVPESSSEAPADDLDGNGRHDRNTVTLGHPPSSFFTRLHQARQKHGPTPPAERNATPQGEVESLKRRAKFLARLISDGVWDHDHREIVKEALQDNIQWREDTWWPFTDEQRWPSEDGTLRFLPDDKVLWRSDEQIEPEVKKQIKETENLKWKFKEMDLDQLREQIKQRHQRFESKIGKNVRIEKHSDTIAVGISPDGKNIYIAGNVKKCENKVLLDGTGKIKDKYPDREQPGDHKFGLHNNKYDETIWKLLSKWDPEATSPDVQVSTINPTIIPRERDEMRAFHAETQIISYAMRNNLPMPIIGVSKPPCIRCEEALDGNGIQYDSNVGRRNENPRNFNEDYLNTEVVATPLARPVEEEGHHVTRRRAEAAPETTRPRISRKTHALGAAKTVVGAVRKAYTTPRVTRPGSISKASPKAIAKAVAKATVHPGLSRRPRITGGIGATLESVIDNWDRPAYADSTPGEYADAGVYHTRTTQGVYAQAGVGMARAGCSVAEVEARGPNVAAGAQAGMVSGVSVFAHAELASAQASVAGVTAKVGLNANTGFSAGPDGVSAEFLGFGFAVGPHLEVDTPIAGVSCVVM